VPGGDVVITGVLFAGSIDFGGGLLENSHYSIQSSFVARFTTDGEHLWSRHLASDETADVYAADVAVLESGATIVTGEFESSVDFGRGTHTIDESADRSAFVVSFDAAGEAQWSSHVPDSDRVIAMSAAGDHAEHAYMAGSAGG
jgi:outer membrane protein assembly factor BamB